MSARTGADFTALAGQQQDTVTLARRVRQALRRLMAPPSAERRPPARRVCTWKRQLNNQGTKTPRPRHKAKLTVSLPQNHSPGRCSRACPGNSFPTRSWLLGSFVVLFPTAKFRIAPVEWRLLCGAIHPPFANPGRVSRLQRRVGSLPRSGFQDRNRFGRLEAMAPRVGPKWAGRPGTALVADSPLRASSRASRLGG